VLTCFSNATTTFQKVSSYIYSALLYIAILSSLLPISAGVRCWNIVGKDMKVLLSLLIIGFIMDCFSVWGYNDLYLPGFAYGYLLLELLSVMYVIIACQESLCIKRLLKIIVILYCAFWIYARFTFVSFSRLYSIAGSVSKIIFVLSAGYTLFIVIATNIESLKKDKRFWILLSFILNSGGTLMPFALQELLFIQSKHALYIAWSITWVVGIISNILFTVGFLCPQKQT
jgi:hypothetical protein